ncbi:uncharacterized protein HKW66_Vig0015800 [Vigna angularis]|uniref:Uncharacterized protein n=1 Tax=Phaseolus angularis TaxID=3914 RepID=A0A8T0LJI8_PHAAN|nr:uncharacterized protein HKW66_Vig0015800 [Vigna angularis]
MPNIFSKKKQKEKGKKSIGVLLISGESKLEGALNCTLALKMRVYFANSITAIIAKNSTLSLAQLVYADAANLTQRAKHSQKETGTSNLCFLQQRGENDDVFLTGIGNVSIGDQVEEVLEREFSVLVFVLVEKFNDVREKGDLAREDQTAVTSESELFLGLFEEPLEDGEVEETRGYGEARAFGADVHEGEPGGRAARGGRVLGAAADAHLLPPRHEVFETHDLANLVDLLIHRTRHWRRVNEEEEEEDLREATVVVLCRRSREVAEIRGLCRVKNGITLTKYRFVRSKAQHVEPSTHTFVGTCRARASKDCAVSNRRLCARDASLA